MILSLAIVVSMITIPLGISSLRNGPMFRAFSTTMNDGLDVIEDEVAKQRLKRVTRSAERQLAESRRRWPDATPEA